MISVCSRRLKYSFYAILFVVSFLPTAYGESSKLKVGVIVSLTGQAADYGESIQNSIQLAIKDEPFLSQHVSFHFEDAAYDPKQAVSAFKKLTMVDKVDLVYVWGVSFCKALGPLAESFKIPLVAQCIDPDTAKGRAYVVRFMNYTDQYLAVTSKYLSSKGVKRIGIVVSENAYLEEMLDALRRNLEPGQSVEVLDRYASNDADFRSIISTLKREEFDAVGVFLSAGQISSFYRQLSEQKVTMITFGTNFFESLSEVQAAQGTMEGAVFANNEVRQVFIERYRNTYGKVTQIGFGALSYEFALTLARILKSADNHNNAVSVLAALRKLKTEQGIAAGPYVGKANETVGSFIEFPIVMKRIEGNKFITLP